MTRTKSSHTLKRLLVLVMIVAMLASFAVPAMAADEYPVPYPDLKITHTKSGYEWGALNDEKTEWGITVYGRSASASYSPTLLFTNNGNEEKILSFDLTAEFGADAANASVQVATGRTGGTFLLTKSEGFANEHIEIALAPNAVLRVVSKSSTGTTIPLTVTLTNLKFVKDSSASVTFLPPENGSYTVDGNAITAETVLTKDASESYVLSATPADGYQFYGWYEKNTDRVLSTAASTSLAFDTDSTVSALFIPSFDAGEAIYGVEMENGYVGFVKFDDAAGFAATMGRPQVTLLQDYTLTESITIPDGVTLVVPFDDARTMYTEVPEIDTKTQLMVTSPAAYVAPSAFRTLTMAPGVSITVANGGALSLSGKISAVGTGAKSYNGTPTGPDGRIVMQGGNAIDVESGGSLYAYGFISGSGSVHAKAGSSVYECFQLRNWRGGNATLGLASSDVFPVSMYYVQNIEVPLTLDAGAAEIARSAVNASSTAMGAGVTFIGEGGMFQVANGSVTKEYVPASDRLVITLDGDASLTSIALKVPEMSVMLPNGIDSANFSLPINNNITVNCTAGSDVTIHQDLAMLPGAVLNIAEGATVTLDESTEVYVYDRDDYVGKGYVAGHDGDSSLDFIPVGYSATNGTAAMRSAADLVDAKVNVDGTVVVNGGFYTTTGGAAIVSEGMTGKVVFASGAGTLTDTHMATQTSNVASVKDVAITSAKLLNGDGSYVLTAEAVAGDEYPYSAAEDKWVEPFHGITVSFDANGGEGEMDAMHVTEDEAADGVELPENGFTRDGYTFVGWSEDPDCAVEDVWRYEGDTIYPVDEFDTADITFYAIWEEQAGTFTVTFNANGGEGTMDPQVITAEVPTALNANTFTREGYNFLYWSDSANGNKLFDDGGTITGEDDLELYAIWQKDHYTLTFHSNFDPDQTTTQEVPLNADSVTLDANTFERDGYEFLGWAFTPNASRAALTDGQTLGFDEDTDLYAVWAKNTFTISFDANGGEGEMLPLNVVKEVSTPLPLNQFTREGYDFIGWATEPNGQIWFGDGDPILTDAVDDFTLYAQWQVREYTITFQNYDGTVLQTYTIEHGQTPGYTGTVQPGRDADAQYTYTFSGWTPAIVPATADATYTAEYDQTLNQYAIRFVDADGTELQSGMVDYGALPVFNGETPAKEATAQYEYAFAGWDPSIKNVDGDQTYTATYSETLRSYTVKWVNEDGTVLDVNPVSYGTVPSYTGAIPTKEATAQYTYTFDGWTEEPVAVTGDVTYTAKYAANVNEYTIKFVDEDGTELQSGSVAYGEMPMAPAEPSKAADAQYTYTFAGWTPEIAAVTGDATYTATYSSELNKYTVTWNNWDGTLLLAEDYDYGAAPSYTGGTPEKEGDAQYTYTFSGWDKELTPVTGDVTFTAVFSSTVNTYTITWLDEDGTILETDTEVPYGTTPTFDGEEPTKAETDTTVYSFGGWTPEVASVTGDASYTAVFTSSDRLYDVQWLAEDGSVLETQSGMKFDDELTYPGTAEPTKEGDAQYSYTFSGWTRTVEGDKITMRPSFEQSVNTYTVTWIVEGETVETDEDVPYGTAPSFDGETPVKEATAQYTYAFAGWDKALEPITGDTEFTATFTSEENTYQLTFNANGADGEMTPQTLTYGVETAIKANTFTYAGHYFMGWNTAADGSGTAYAKDGTIAITADTELFAQWAPDGWVRDDNGIRYYVEGEALRSGWTQLDDGNWYYFYPETGYAATGCAMVPYAPAETGNTYGPYEVDLKPEAGHPEYAAAYAENGEFVFDENGVFQLSQTGKIMKDGSEWWCQNGEILWHARLVTDGTNYYYGSAGGQLKRSVTDWIGDTNDLLPAGTYTFADDGHIIMYNGIVELDGTKWYYENGRRTYKGLFQVGENGDYYYATSDGSLVCGQDFLVSKTNGLMDAAVRTFDADGRMVLNGLVEMNGELWYFENGVKTPKGLVKVGDDYYYIKQNGAAVRGTDYYVTKTNDLMDKGLYTFGADGKMVITTPEVKNGLIKEADGTWYYVDGVKTHAGLLLWEGDYYYIKTNGQAVTDTRYFVSNTNGYMDRAYHTFDADGRMTDVPQPKNGLVEENGRLWYYENGEKAHPGLIKIGEDYYYICTTGYAVAGCDYYVSNTNDLMPKGTYTFAADGKMIVPDLTPKNGLIEEDGTLWYYVDGVKTHAGLIVIDGSYYYIKSNGSAVRDCDYFISDTNGLMERGTHHFNADGTMVP